MTPKQFDCVQMKGDIQQQLAEEFAGMPEAEAQRIIDQRIATNPILGPVLKRIRVISYPSTTASAFGGPPPTRSPIS
jgi:hypothetical protein